LDEKGLKYFNQATASYAVALAKEGFKMGGHTWMAEKFPSYDEAYSRLNGHQMLIAMDLALALQERGEIKETAINPQSPEQIQAHYDKQQSAAEIVAKYFFLPTSLVQEFCAAQCPPSNHKWNDKNAGSWLQEQPLSFEQLAKHYQIYLRENSHIFSKVYENCY